MDVQLAKVKILRTIRRSLAWLKIFNPKRRRIRRELTEKVTAAYGMGASMVRVLNASGYKSLCVWCDKSDFVFGATVCYELERQMEFTVMKWLSDCIYIGSKYHMSGIELNIDGVVQLTKDDTVLVLSSTPVLHKRLAKSGAKIIHIMDIIDELRFDGVNSRFIKLHERCPFLPILLICGPSSPKNKSSFIDMEKWIISTKFSVYIGMGQQKLREGVVPKPFEKFNYSAQDILDMSNSSFTFVENNFLKSKNYSSRCVNVVDNHRVTVGSPEKYENSIYFFGGCTYFGTLAPDDKTIESFLQSKLSDYRVENYSAYAAGRFNYLWNLATEMPYSAGDILITYIGGYFPKNLNLLRKYYKGYFALDLEALFERPHDFGDDIYLDSMNGQLGHYSENGYKVIADKIYDYLCENDFFKDFISQNSAPPRTRANDSPKQIITSRRRTRGLQAITFSR